MKNYNQIWRTQNTKNPIVLLFIQMHRTNQNYIFIQTPQNFQFDFLTADKTFKYY